MDYFINSTGIITWIVLVINATLFYVRYLAYWKKLEKRIENELYISSIPALKEKLHLLKETVEDTQENLTHEKIPMQK